MWDHVSSACGCTLRAHPGQGARIVFLDLPALFDRAGLFGEAGNDYQDNAVRFFCRAALRALPLIAPGTQVVHAHDWHAALAPVYLPTVLARNPLYQA